MNRDCYSFNDNFRNIDHVDDEYNNELESYLYSNIYYTHDEHDQIVEGRSNDNNISQNKPLLNNNAQPQRRSARLARRHSPYNCGKKMPPHFRGISQHLSQESNANDNKRNRSYHSSATSKGTGTDCNSSAFHHTQYENKYLIRASASPQHIQFEDQDIDDVSDEPESTTPSKNNKQPASHSKEIMCADSIQPELISSKEINSTELNTTIIQSSEQQSLKYNELEERFQSNDTANVSTSVTDTSSKEYEEYSKYNVLKANDKEKLHDKGFSGKFTADSDSDESILEVPIPPKPQPPLISLNDSDEDLSLPRSTVEKHSLSEGSELDFLPTTADAIIESTSSENYEKERVIQPTNSQDALQKEKSNDDLILNCTQIRKCNTSLLQIRNLSKTARQEQMEDCAQSLESHTSVQSIKDKLNSSTETSHQILSSITDNMLIETEQSQCTAENSIDALSINKKGNNKTAGSTKSMSSQEIHGMKQKGKKRPYESVSQQSIYNKQSQFSNDNSDMYETTADDTGQLKQQDSEFSWEQYFFKPMSAKMKAFYNEILGDKFLEVHELQRRMSRDPRLWGILDADLMPSPAKRSKSRCGHCHQDGHVKSNCPQIHQAPLCYMCGMKGHREPRCPKSVCLTCGKKQPMFRKTCDLCKKRYCSRCKAIGHKDTNCPDLWRKYHQTITSSEITLPSNQNNIMKPKRNLHCCNCTRRGHDVYTCKEYRWSQHYPTPAYVSNYTDSPLYEIENPMNRTEFSQKQSPSTSSSQAGKSSSTEWKIIYVCESSSLDGCSYKQENEISHRNHHLNSVIDGKIRPLFLEELSKRILFKTEFYTNSNRSLKIRCITTKSTTRNLIFLINHWLQLEDDEKNMWLITELPYHKNVLISILSKKFNELTLNLEDPRTLIEKIYHVKQDLNKLNNVSARHHTYVKCKESLLNLKSKLQTVTCTQPQWTRPCRALYEMIENLQSDTHLSPITYLTILRLYTVTFAPFTPLYLDHYIGRYCKLGRAENSTRAKHDYQNFTINENSTQSIIPQVNSASCLQQETTEFESPYDVSNANINEERFDNFDEVSSSSKTNVFHLAHSTIHSTNLTDKASFNKNGTTMTMTSDLAHSTLGNLTAFNSSESISNKVHETSIVYPSTSFEIQKFIGPSENMITDNSSKIITTTSNPYLTKDEKSGNFNKIYDKTTLMTSVQVAKETASATHCFNCTKSVHDFAECKERPANTNYQDACKIEISKLSKGRLPNPSSSLTGKTDGKKANKKAAKNSLTWKTVYAYESSKLNANSKKQEVEYSRRKHNLNSVVDGKIQPLFLEELAKRFRFKVEFFISGNRFKVRCVTAETQLKPLMHLMRHWLKLQDHEKNWWLVTDLPYHKEKLLNILNQKFDEVTDNLGDPKTLSKKITQLEQEMKNLEKDRTHYNMYCKHKESLFDLKSKLQALLSTQPEWSKPYKTLYELTKDLQLTPKLSPEVYLDILRLYNVTFAPFAPIKLKRVLKKYYNFFRMQKSIKVKSNLVPIYINETSVHASSEEKPRLPQKSKIFCVEQSNTKSETPETMLHANVSGKGFKNFDETASSDNIDFPYLKYNTSHLTNSSDNVSLVNNDTGMKIASNSASTISNNREFPSTSQCVSKNHEKQNCVSKSEIKKVGNLSKITSGIPSSPLIKDQESVNRDIVHNELTEKMSRQIGETESDTQTDKNCKENSNTSLQKQNVESNQVSTDTATKAPSAVIIKEEPDVCAIEYNTPKSSMEASKLSQELVASAEKVINIALDLQLPYLNKAVADMQRKLSAKTLENKHIEVLQKLIDLEKLHQHHVNTFSKFLE